MAKNDGSLHNIPLEGQVNLNKFEGVISDWKDYLHMNSPMYGGVLSTLYKKDLSFEERVFIMYDAADRAWYKKLYKDDTGSYTDIYRDDFFVKRIKNETLTDKDLSKNNIIAGTEEYPITRSDTMYSEVVNRQYIRTKYLSKGNKEYMLVACWDKADTFIDMYIFDVSNRELVVHSEYDFGELEDDYYIDGMIESSAASFMLVHIAPVVSNADNFNYMTKKFSLVDGSEDTTTKYKFKETVISDNVDTSGIHAITNGGNSKLTKNKFEYNLSSEIPVSRNQFGINTICVSGNTIFSNSDVYNFYANGVYRFDVELSYRSGSSVEYFLVTPVNSSDEFSAEDQSYISSGNSAFGLYNGIITYNSNFVAIYNSSNKVTDYILDNHIEGYKYYSFTFSGTEVVIDFGSGNVTFANGNKIVIINGRVYKYTKDILNEFYYPYTPYGLYTKEVTLECEINNFIISNGRFIVIADNHVFYNKELRENNSNELTYYIATNKHFNEVLVPFSTRDMKDVLDVSNIGYNTYISTENGRTLVTGVYQYEYSNLKYKFTADCNHLYISVNGYMDIYATGNSLVNVTTPINDIYTREKVVSITRGTRTYNTKTQKFYSTIEIGLNDSYGFYKSGSASETSFSMEGEITQYKELAYIKRKTVSTCPIIQNYALPTAGTKSDKDTLSDDSFGIYMGYKTENSNGLSVIYNNGYITGVGRYNTIYTRDITNIIAVYEDAIYYTDYLGNYRVIKINNNENKPVTNKVVDSYIIFDSCDTLNSVDTQYEIWFNPSLDWNNRFNLHYKNCGLLYTEENFVNNYYNELAFASYKRTTNEPSVEYVASAINEQYSRDTKENWIGAINNPVFVYAMDKSYFDKVFVLDGNDVEYYKNVFINIYTTLDNTAILYYKSIPYDQDLKGSVYPITTADAYYNMSLGDKLINTYYASWFVKTNNYNYKTLVNGTTQKPVLGYRLNEQTELEGLFVIQGSSYGYTDKYIIPVTYGTSTVELGDACVNIKGMQYIASTPYLAYFYSAANRSIYAFSGDNTLNKVFESNRITTIYKAFYNTSTQVIYAITNDGILCLNENGSMFKFEENNWTDIEQTDDFIYLVNEERNDIRLVSYNFKEDYDKVPIEFETELYGTDDFTVNETDCVYIRIVTDEDYNDFIGDVEITSHVLTQTSKKTDTKVFHIEKKDWDMETSTILLRYQPKYQQGVGFSVKVKSDFPISAMYINSSPISVTNSKNNI